jgi:hypothetical protein
VVALTGLASGTWAHQLPAQVLHRWGTGLHQLLHGRVWTLLTGGAFSHGPFMYWALILALIPLGVGVYEWIAGTRNALLVYWATDLGGSLAVAFGLILPLSLLGDAVGHELLHMRDVGMSGGGFGCIGALVHRLPPQKRRLAAGLGVAYLLARLATLTDVRADALHLLAFAGGFLLDGRFGHADGDPRRRSGPAAPVADMRSSMALRGPDPAPVDVIVHQPHGLHERIDGSGADEAPAAFAQFLAQCGRFRTLGDGA